jgi:PAS domain S-box-containing protein
MRDHLITLLTFLAYVAAAEIGSVIHTVVGYSPSIWPPAGIAVAGILLGHRFVPAAVFLAAALINYDLGLALGSSIIVAAGSTLAAWLAASAIKSKRDLDWGFGRPRDVMYFFIVAPLASPLVAALTSTATLTFSNLIQGSEISNFFYSFWLGDGLGVLMVVPVAMIWSTVPARVTVIERLWEFAALAIVSASLATYLFIDFETLQNLNSLLFPRIFIGFPILIWAVLRFGPLGLSTVMLIASVIATYGATHQAWMGKTINVPDGVNTVQLFIGITTLTGLILAAAIRNTKLNEEKFRSMFEGSDVPMAEVNIRGEFILVNDRFCALTGYSRDELLNKNFPELTHPDDIAHEAILFRRLISKESPVLKVEKRYLTKAGKIIWIAVDATLINHGPGRDPTSIAVVQDITQRKLAEESAKSSQEEALEANKAKSDFLSTMSHEIRTPLGVILGFSELLSDPNLEQNLRVEFTQTIRRNSLELGSLVDNILDLSKIEAGKLDISSGTISLTTLFKDVLEMFQSAANAKGIRVNSNIDVNVPQKFKTDGKRLRQILVNVIANALKFTATGSIDISASIDSTKGLGALVILVKDTGSGIDKEDIPILFQPFRQSKQARNRHMGGTGLGLVLSRQLAQLLGGDVRLKESQQGVGSTFEIVIQIDQEPNTVLNPTFKPSSLVIGPFTDHQLQNMKILIAEDTPDQRMLIKILLEDLGADVDVAENGLEAVTKALEGDYSIVLMDMQMPVLSGYEATTKLRAQGFTKPVLALTAQAMRTDQSRCRESGCNGHLSKPFTQETLVAAIRECMAVTAAPGL